MLGSYPWVESIPWKGVGGNRALWSKSEKADPQHFYLQWQICHRVCVAGRMSNCTKEPDLWRTCGSCRGKEQSLRKNIFWNDLIAWISLTVMCLLGLAVCDCEGSNAYCIFVWFELWLIWTTYFIWIKAILQDPEGRWLAMWSSKQIY